MPPNSKSNLQNARNVMAYEEAMSKMGNIWRSMPSDTNKPPHINHTSTTQLHRNNSGHVLITPNHKGKFTIPSFKNMHQAMIKNGGKRRQTKKHTRRHKKQKRTRKH